jgi:hypothetical protein
MLAGTATTNPPGSASSRPRPGATSLLEPPESPRRSRSRSHASARASPPLPVATVQPTTQHTPIPSDIMKIINKEFRQFKSDLDSFVRTKSRFEEAKAQNDVFVNSDSDYPQGVRSFRADATFPELDLPWSLSAASMMTFTINIPQGTSRKEAGFIFHRAFAKHWKGIQMEAHYDALQSTQESISLARLERLLRSCMDSISELDRAESLGIHRPTPRVSEDVVRAVIDKKYAALYGNFENDLVQRATRAADEKAAAAARDDRLSAKDPARILTDVVKTSVSSEVCAQLEKLGYAIDPEDVPMPDTASSSVPQFVDSLTKNVLSPSAGVGQSSQLMVAKPKSAPAPPASKGKKGKGKGKDKGKGKPGKHDNKSSDASGSRKGSKGTAKGMKRQ